MSSQESRTLKGTQIKASCRSAKEFIFHHGQQEPIRVCTETIELSFNLELGWDHPPTDARVSDWQIVAAIICVRCLQ